MRALHFSPCFSVDIFYAQGEHGDRRLSMSSHKCGAHCNSTGCKQADWVVVVHALKLLGSAKRASVSLLHSEDGSLSFGLGWEKRERFGKTKIVGHSGVIVAFISCKSLRLL